MIFSMVFQTVDVFLIHPLVSCNGYQLNKSNSIQRHIVKDLSQPCLVSQFCDRLFYSTSVYFYLFPYFVRYRRKNYGKLCLLF